MIIQPGLKNILGLTLTQMRKDNIYWSLIADLYTVERSVVYTTLFMYFAPCLNRV